MNTQQIITVTTNEELKNLASQISADMYAIRLKGEIKLFTNYSDFTATAATNPNSPQGKFSAYNWHWYRF